MGSFRKQPRLPFNRRFSQASTFITCCTLVQWLTMRQGAMTFIAKPTMFLAVKKWLGWWVDSVTMAKFPIIYLPIAISLDRQLLVDIICDACIVPSASCWHTLSFCIMHCPISTLKAARGRASYLCFLLDSFSWLASWLRVHHSITYIPSSRRRARNTLSV